MSENESAAREMKSFFIYCFLCIIWVVYKSVNIITILFKIVLNVNLNCSKTIVQVNFGMFTKIINIYQRESILPHPNLKFSQREGLLSPKQNYWQSSVSKYNINEITSSVT